MDCCCQLTIDFCKRPGSCHWICSEPILLGAMLCIVGISLASIALQFHDGSIKLPLAHIKPACITVGVLAIVSFVAGVIICIKRARDGVANF